MGAIHTPKPVLFFIAAFSPLEETLERGAARAVDDFGPIWRESPVFRFDAYTAYYAGEMGPVLYKKFWAFERLIDPGRLAAIKVLTNRREEEFASQYAERLGVARPLNLDPGYIDLGKLVLASTKDHGHRIYLSDGIFAEITLSFSQKRWQALPWTYADYQSEGYQAFFDECRERLHAERLGAARL